MKLWRLQKSFCPVLIALPNSGSFLPPEIAAHMTDAAKGFTSNACHLIQLCEGPELRDVGVIASNVSPLVVDLSQPLPPSLQPPIEAHYPCKTPNGQQIYIDDNFSMSDADHQLRRETFYLPFFQKLFAELDRMETEFGKAVLLVLEYDDEQTSAAVELAAAEHKYGSSDEIKGIISRRLRDDEVANNVVLQRAITEAAAVKEERAGQRLVCKATVPAACFMRDGQWSDELANSTRSVLASVVEALTKTV